jgi:hypothetical protein
MLGSNHYSDTAAPICDASINIEDGNATGNTDTNVPALPQEPTTSRKM